MAKTIATGYTDTAIAGNPAMTVTIGKLNHAVDHRMVKDDPGEVVTTNVTCPVDQPETLRYSQRLVKDVYANTGIDAASYLPVKNGTATLLELREVWVETDSGDTTYRKLIPIKVGLNFQIPSYANITSDMVQTAILRTVSLAHETGLVTSTGIASLLRGVMRKADAK